MKATTIKAWSYSRWSTYQTCPAKAKYQIIDRLPMQESEAMQNGKAKHLACELYLKGAHKAVPAELASIKGLLVKLRKAGAVAELEWCFNPEWALVDWLAKDAWLRVKLDACLVTGPVMEMYDWKTGKMREGYQSQLDLYALAGFLAEPAVKEIHTKLVYLDQGGKVVENTYLRTELPKLKKQWLKDTQAMLNDTSFAPLPNNLCRWCPYSKKENGPCRF